MTTEIQNQVNNDRQTGDRVYLMRTLRGSQDVIAGPFPADDDVDDKLFDAIAAAAWDHPYEDYVQYRALSIIAGEPTVDSFDMEFLDSALIKGWEEGSCRDLAESR